MNSLYLYNHFKKIILYAIVDIETTGGYAANNAITEVAIVLYNGKEIKRYETLVNPGMPIPRYVQALTGINDEMVSDAPSFDDIAENVFQILNDVVFVAHNVNFDYSFLNIILKFPGSTSTQKNFVQLD
jgi:DNA polymerase-3 subunit epsilon